ncbi:MAG: ATP-binding protein [Bacteroidales bacterium]|nr:ATP-binding protein [Bacteroidales bacterium]
MEIAVISGKGGTGKSCFSAAFATLKHKVVLADCDVDAANLFILFNPEIIEEKIYISGQKAIINQSKCTRCGICIDYCRFDAISYKEYQVVINETSCDGCKLCTRICPSMAIDLINSDKSKMFSGNFRNGKMVYGRLAPGEENSGKLVSLVREKAREIAKANHLDTIIIDGPPGIGCSVISSLTGVNHAVIISEPSLSGLSDLKRTLEIVSKFNIKTWVIINKYDLNKDVANDIFNYCHDNNIILVGKIPFSSDIVTAMVHCQSIIEYAPYSNIALEIERIYNMIIDEQ